eukprot:7686227-Ditylum_brightwellii.AAC.1
MSAPNGSSGNTKERTNGASEHKNQGSRDFRMSPPQHNIETIRMKGDLSEDGEVTPSVVQEIGSLGRKKKTCPREK